MTIRTTLTTTEAAAALGMNLSRVLKLCRDGRLGYTLPRHGRSWMITSEELAWHREYGALPPGRPRKKSR